MARREDIDTSIWSDPDFLDLSPNAKLVYVWSFTNQRCGMSGLYQVVKPAIALETGMDTKALEASLVELCASRFVFYDGRWIWVRSRVKHMRTTGRNMAKSIAGDLARAGNHEYVHRFMAAYARLEWLHADGLLDDIPKGSPRGSLEGPSDPCTPSEPWEGFQGKGKGYEEGQGVQDARASASTTRQARFNGKPIPQPVLVAAQAVLADLNRQSGHAYRPFTDQGALSDNLSRIVGAMLEDQRITVEIGQRMISLALAGDPYWQPGPFHAGHAFGKKTRESLLVAALANGATASTDAAAYVAAMNRKDAA